MFPIELKKVNIVPVDKKGDNQCVKNYNFSSFSACQNVWKTHF